MKKYFLSLMWLFSINTICAQNITHGPVVGGLTHTSARLYVRTHTAQPFVLALSTFANFSQPVITINSATIPQQDSSVLININSLLPDTRYYYKLLFNGVADSKTGSFRTFPVENTPTHLLIATGSCQETDNMKVFDRIAELQPNLFIHSGDFTYPSYQMGNDYPVQYTAVQESWRRRYNENRMKDMLLNVPIDYILDDDDNYAGDCTNYHTGISWTIDTTNFIHYTFQRDTVLSVSRNNVFSGYRTFFPGYNLVDSTHALYHKFILGNCEFFVLDVRSEASPPDQPFRYDTLSRTWQYQPDSTYLMISHQQMNWLKQGLLKSNAQWKIIVSGVPFNRQQRILLQAGIDLQQLYLPLGSGFAGMKLATSMAGYWAGHPHQQNELLSFIADNNIDNLLFVSGDSHVNMLDDGTNAGIPEINASGLSVAEFDKKLFYFIELLAPALGYPAIIDSVWNKGGTGLGNTNFKNGFGTIEVFGNDSLKVCAIDEDGAIISCMTLSSSSKPPPIEPNQTNDLQIYPNPANQWVSVSLPKKLAQIESGKWQIIDLQGKVLQQYITPANNNMGITFEIKDYPTGLYIVRYEGKTTILSKPFTKIN